MGENVTNNRIVKRARIQDARANKIRPRTWVWFVEALLGDGVLIWLPTRLV